MDLVQVDYSVVLDNLKAAVANAVMDAAVAKAESVALREHITRLEARIQDLQELEEGDAAKPQ